jgi:hypothetical protein
MTSLAQEHSKPHSFMDMTNEMILAEREKPSMVDAFTAMTLDRRANKAQHFGEFMAGFARAD